MAIDPFDLIEVVIVSNGVTLQEHNDPDSLELNPEGVAFCVAKYVEAISNVEFAIIVQVTDEEIFQPDNLLLLDIYIDGQQVARQALGPNKRRIVVDAWRTRVSSLTDFERFLSRSTVESDDPVVIEKDEEAMSKVGEIIVEVWHAQHFSSRQEGTLKIASKADDDIAEDSITEKDAVIARNTVTDSDVRGNDAARDNEAYGPTVHAITVENDVPGDGEAGHGREGTMAASATRRAEAGNNRAGSIAVEGNATGEDEVNVVTAGPIEANDNTADAGTAENDIADSKANKGQFFVSETDIKGSSISYITT